MLFAVYIVIGIYIALIGYFLAIEYIVRKKIKKIESNPDLHKTVGERQIILARKWGSKMRLGLSKTNFFLVPTNIILALVSVSALNTGQRNALEANRINKEVADVQYDNAQPFLALMTGNSDGTKVRVKNAGGGVAKNIFFAKHYINASGTDVYHLSRQDDVILTFSAGQEGDISLNAQSMDRFEDKNSLLSTVPCLSSLMLDRRVWITAFYRNLKGDPFMSKFNAEGNPYGDTTEFKKLPSC
jgi:hypothetical protein